MWPMIIGAGVSLLGDYLNKSGSKNPAGPAQNYMDQISGVLKGAFNPYIQAGQQALPTLQGDYAAMQNPNFINNMGQNFQQSPGYNFQVNQALNSANRAAAAGGMVGSPEEQQNIAGVTSGLANQDYYNWLNHAMSAYGMGVQGDQSLYNTGFQASSEYGNDLAQALMNQAQLAYSGQINSNQSGGIGSLLGGLGSMIPNMFGSKSGGGGGGMFNFGGGSSGNGSNIGTAL